MVVRPVPTLPSVMHVSGGVGEFDEYAVFGCFMVLCSDVMCAVQSAGGDSDVGFLAGKKLSMADIRLFPHLALFVRFGLELEPRFPHLARYYQKMLQLPSVKKTWPPHWVGTEAPKKLFVAA